ncbi:DUF6415 family natural product biosynthesis protein [Streptomyces sp. NBC_01304]|uniref:DUF6415 family natural product biosynthesis protein n=1 Tax=Streptomyces sp. NBC_01304 TaxID=2903818 RepID=UPI002E0FCAFB|nr:DUF6415 family natural product biosynthesis protein [Streptomyces sp. NBC_01304]
MAALTPTVPDKVEVLANVNTVLDWDLSSPDVPSAADSVAVVEQFTAYSQVLAKDLRTLCLSILADSEVGVRARSILGETSGRLSAPLPSPLTDRYAARRAQNLARLIQGLLRATAQVREAQERAVSQLTTHSTPKGNGCSSP